MVIEMKRGLNKRRSHAVSAHLHAQSLRQGKIDDEQEFIERDFIG